ncbi:MAG: S-layer homology domain-containing protein [Candidatus Margulisiibacteriota bacterium]|jgi:tetratricopeptide (TPR) repeat protein
MKKVLEISIIILALSGCLLFAEENKAPDKKSALETEQEIQIVKKIIGYRNTARSLFVKGLYRDSVLSYEKLLAIQPDDAMIIRELEVARKAAKYADSARILYAEKNYEEVVATCKNLLALNPNDAQARSYYGSAQNITKYQVDAADFFVRGEFAQAILNYNNVLKITPGDRSVIEKIKVCAGALEARKFFKEGEYQKAISRYRQALTYSPNNKIVPQELKVVLDANESRNEARIAYGENNYKDAANYYLAVLRINDSDKEAKTRLASIQEIVSLLKNGDQLLTAGDYQNATAVYEKALLLDPRSTVIQDKVKLSKQAVSLKEQGREVKASLPKDKQEYDSIVSKIVQEETKDQVRQSEEALTKEFITYRNDARKQFAKGDYNAAMVSYKQALAISPEDKQMTDELAKCTKAMTLTQKGKDLFAQKKYNAAKEVAQQLLTITPKAEQEGEDVAADVPQAGLTIYSPSDKQIVYDYNADVSGLAKDVTEVMVNNNPVRMATGGSFSVRVPLSKIGKNTIALSYQDKGKTRTERLRVLRLANFLDIDNTIAYEVGLAANMGLIYGDEQGYFKPDDSILTDDFKKMLSKIDSSLTTSGGGKLIARRDALKLLVMLLNISLPTEKYDLNIKDIPASDPDYGYFAAAQQAGLLTRMVNQDNVFRPADKLTRLEAIYLGMNIPAARTKIKDLVNWETGY